MNIQKKKYAAFVIGINNYDNNSHLTNAENDARAMADILRELKFTVYELIGKDASHQEFMNIQSNILSNNFYDHYDALVLYFSGHGFVANLSDCLALKDCAQITRCSTLAKGNSIVLQDFFEVFHKQQIPMIIAILDACREDVSEYMDAADGTRGGLYDKDFGKNVNAPLQTFIAYSTSLNQTASDGGQLRHSLYTQALLEEIKSKIPIETLFKRIRKRMEHASSRQVPWEYSCLIDDFSFNYGQLDAYYEKSYLKDAYQYGNGNYLMTPENVHQLVQIIQNRGSYSGLRENLVQISQNKAELDDNAKFVIGRMLCEAAAADKDALLSLISDNIFLNLFNEGKVNHILRGIYYALYFDKQDVVRFTILGDGVFWQALERLYDLTIVKEDIKKFIASHVMKYVDKFNYIVGSKRPYRIHIDAEELDSTNSDDEHLIGIRVIDEEKNNILSQLDIDNDFFDDQILREALIRFYKVPSQWLSVDSHLDAEYSQKYTKLRISQSQLYMHMLSNVPDDICVLSSNSYVTDVYDLVINEVVDEGMQLSVKGNCNVSVHVEYDHDELPDSYFPCTFEFLCDLNDEGDYEINEESVNYQVDTSSYYE